MLRGLVFGFEQHCRLFFFLSFIYPFRHFWDPLNGYMHSLVFFFAVIACRSREKKVVRPNCSPRNNQCNWRKITEEKERQMMSVFPYLGQVQTGTLASVVVVAVHVEDLLALDRQKTRENALSQTSAHNNDVVLLILSDCNVGDAKIPWVRLIAHQVFKEQ